MELGFHTIHFSPMFGGSVPILEVIRLTAQAGFDAVGVDLASVEAHGSIPDVAAAIAGAGLRCTDVLVLLPGGDDDVLESARTLGALAAAVGAPACIAAIAAPVARSELVASLGECAAILADHGCRLSVEFTPYSALPTLPEAKALCEAIGWDRCGVVIDSLHFFRSGAPWDELAGGRAADVAVVQWSDAPLVAPDTLADESRHRRLLPGDGGLPLGELASAIRATGWRGVVVAEVLSAGLRRSDPATAVRAVHAAMASVPAGWT